MMSPYALPNLFVNPIEIKKPRALGLIKNTTQLHTALK